MLLVKALLQYLGNSVLDGMYVPPFKRIEESILTASPWSSGFLTLDSVVAVKDSRFDPFWRSRQPNE